jgi:hypothetical protein
MVGQPLDLSELRLRLYLHSLWRTFDQQDWYQVFLFDRGNNDAIAWLFVLCECNAGYRVVLAVGQCEQIFREWGTVLY